MFSEGVHNLALISNIIMGSSNIKELHIELSTVLCDIFGKKYVQ